MSYPKASGTLTMYRESSSTLVVRMAGDLMELLLERRKKEFLDLLGEAPTPFWILELSELTGLSSDIVTGMSEWWQSFKDQQGTHVFFVVTLAPVEMVASALKFPAGLCLVSCASLSEARARLAPMLVARPGD